jgi:hypothetical protein
LRDTRARFDGLKAEFEQLAAALAAWEEKAEPVWQAITKEMIDECPDLSDVEVPRSEASGRTGRFVLFDSSCDYLTQMDHYNVWKDGEATDD